MRRQAAAEVVLQVGSDLGYDILINSAMGGKIAVGVLTFVGPFVPGSFLRDRLYRAFYMKSESGLDDYMIFLVNNNQIDWEPVTTSMLRNGPEITISGGHLTEDGQYEETFQFKPQSRA